MRRFTNDMFSGKQIKVFFSAPTSGLDSRLGSDTKRQLYRVFKEGLHNAVRHSECTEIRVELTSAGSSLRLVIRDDGKGFDPQTATVGHGLDSMRNRSKTLGGQLEIRTGLGQGTEIVLEIPHGRKRS